ncbi:MAG: glycosyltransferase family 39 protein [Elusimicrobiaceae bacterium]|nr:glycosyltransferase family 39 protein [Elusimicrobiaceae bacterium]
MQNIIKFFTDKRNFKYFILIAFAVLYFWQLGSYGLMNPDEGRYSEIPREMLESGDFLTLHLNYVSYFEKPPLHYWLTAVSFLIFGQNEFASRFIPALMGFLTILMTWFTARKFEGEDTANFSAIILGTSALFFAISRINITDMTLSFFLTLSLFSFYIFYKENRKRWLYVFYAALAFATLAKGLIGIILPAGVIFWFMVFKRDWSIMKRLFLSPAILLFFLICVPPFYLVCKKNPDFFYFFFIQEHFLRYSTKMHDRYAPFWFFIPIIIGGFFPWLGGLFVSYKNYFSKKDENIYLVLWVLIITLFFSASHSKLAPYIIPVYPALAILIAKNLIQLKDTGSSKAIKACLGFLTFFTIVLVMAAVLILNGIIPIRKIQDVLLYRMPITCLCMLCVVFCIMFWAMLNRPKKLFALYSVFAFCFILTALPAIKILGNERSTRVLNKTLVPLLNPQDKVLNFKDYQQDLPFYTKRRVAIAGWTGELYYGREKDKDADNWFIDIDKVEKYLKQPLQEGQKLYVVINDEYLGQMPNREEDFEYIGRDDRMELNIYVRKY